MATPKWFDEVDILRGFAILAVILIHVCGTVTQVSSLNALVITNFFIAIFSFAFAVPLFVFVSGFSLSNKYYGSFSYSRFLRKRLNFIIPPYIIFSIFYSIVSNGFNSMSSLHTTLNILLTQNYNGFLWFIPLIIQFYLLYPPIIRAYDYFNHVSKLKLLFGLAIAMQMLWNIITFGQPIGASIPFISHLLYFLLGIYTARNYEWVKLNILNIKKIYIYGVLALSLVFMTGLTYIWLIRFTYIDSYFKGTALYFILPICLLLALFIFILVLCIRASLYLTEAKNLSAHVFQSFGCRSLGIYLVHPYFIFILLPKSLENFGLSVYSGSYYVLLFTMAALLSYLVVYLLNFVPHSEFIIGTRKRIGVHRLDLNDDEP